MTAENKRIEQIFSEAMDAVSPQTRFTNHYQLIVETRRDTRRRVSEKSTFYFDPFVRNKKHQAFYCYYLKRKLPASSGYSNF